MKNPTRLEEVYEPYLIMEGYLKRTPQGRVATELSYKKLGLKGQSRQAAKLPMNICSMAILRQILTGLLLASTDGVRR